MYGLRPIAEMQFADFIMPAVNQIVSEAAKIRYRSNNDWSCPIVIRAPYGEGFMEPYIIRNLLKLSLQINRA